MYIADGALRQACKAQKKEAETCCRNAAGMLEGIGDKLKEGKKVFDAELRSALKNLGKADSGH